jgi:ribosomal protein S18 acetylase RimI-like enzyme
VALSLRTGRSVDLEDVLRLWSDAGSVATSTDDLPSLARLVARDPAALVVAEDDGVIVGSVIAGWDGWRGSIYRLAVSPAHRRAGLGAQLLAEAERRLTDQGAVRLQAIVDDEDPGATGFWQSTGWEQQSHRLRFVTG